MIHAIKAKYIILPGETYKENSAVLVQNNLIKKIVSFNELEDKNYKIIDLKNSVLTPGFVNSHIHLELHWTHKLLKPFNSFPEWLLQIIDLKKNYNNSKIPKSVKQSIDESINSGVTTIGQISSYDGLDYSQIINSGIRTAYFYELTNTSMKNIKKKFFQKILRRNFNSLFHLRIFPHSIYSLNTDSLKKILTLARKNKKNLGIHLSESIDEIKYIKGKKNYLEANILSKLKNKIKIAGIYNSPLEYLDKLNNYNQQITLVHMNNLLKKDYQILKKKRYPVVICPRSNLYLNQKLPDINFFIDYDNTGLGTDGLSSNLSIDFLDEINFLYLHSKKATNKNVEKKVLNIATIGGAKALGLEKIIGTIEPNKKADLVAFKLINKDPFLSIMHSKKKHLKMSMINGKILRLK